MFYSIAKTLIDLYQDVENKTAEIFKNKEVLKNIKLNGVSLLTIKTITEQEVLKALKNNKKK